MNDNDRNRRLILNTIITAILVIGAGFGVYFLAKRVKQNKTVPSTPPIVQEEKQETPQTPITQPQNQTPEKQPTSTQNKSTTPQNATQKMTPVGQKTPMSGPSIPEPFPY